MPKPLKIGFDAKRAFTNNSGLGNYARWLIDSMLQYFPEHEYYLFTTKVNEEFATRYESFKQVTIVSPESKVGKLFPSLWRTYSIAEMCSDLKLDVYHGLSNELPVGIEKFNGKKIVTIHDLIFMRYPYLYSNIDRYIYKKKFFQAVHAADLVIATSKQTADDVESYFNVSRHKIQVVYQDCNSRFSKSYSAAEKTATRKKYQLPEKFVLNVSTFHERKNQLELLKGFHQANITGLHLVLIGKRTDYAIALDEYITQYQLDTRVHILPDISHSDLPVIVSMAHLFVYNSSFEGFGIPILEAMRARVPLITSNISSMPEVAGEAALYVSPKDIDEISNAIRTVHQNNVLRNGLVEKGIEQAHLFDTSKLMEEMSALYDA